MCTSKKQVLRHAAACGGMLRLHWLGHLCFLAGTRICIDSYVATGLNLCPLIPWKLPDSQSCPRPQLPHHVHYFPPYLLHGALQTTFRGLPSMLVSPRSRPFGQ